MTGKASLQATLSGWYPPDVNLKPTKNRRTRNTRCRPPKTPLLKWEMEKNDGGVEEELEDEEVGDRRRRRKGASTVSARKLAAGLWRSQSPGTVTPGDGERRRDQIGVKAGIDFIGSPLVHHHEDRIHGSNAKDPLPSPASVSGTKNGLLHKIEPSIRYSNSAMEGATKWDPVCLKSTDGEMEIYSQMKHIDQQASAESVVSALEAELEQAQARIEELEREHQSSKKKLEHFLRKVSEERAEWRSKEHEKIRAFIDDVKADLNREKKNRRRMEIVNSKLVNELAAAKLSAKQYMQSYEKERKARELVEEVCDELAKEIAKDKAEVEALKRDSVMLREEVDEERKMLQMVGNWREDCAQMKLIDAKIALETRYSQMNKLVADLETFLRSRTGTLDPKDMREAESLRQAAVSVNAPNLDDILAVFEDEALPEASETEIESCVAYSSASYASKVHTASPEISMTRKGGFLRHSSANVEKEDESGWETVSHLEYPSSSCSPGGNAASVNKTNWHNYFSSTETEGGLCSLPDGQLKKVSSMARLWRSCQKKVEKYKTISVEGTNGRLSNGRKLNWGIMSPDQESINGGFSPSEMVGRWSSPDSTHPHITKTCSGSSGGTQTSSLKAKLLEARTETQKVQLRHVLKQEI
ncbi:uncharacterized protein LOC120167188 [Hibiscus syriacus]|uniref:uncharacterized protein LOC120167188 n=1 Tax=Hibiscus syriacus TaxID=106335 RepID=UPI00192166D5|nr:uncharacterized protein LOC120167188 [Hibiscus syriacus]